MATFKCKMCGGALEINENQTVCECEYCGSQQTLPRLSDDRKANLYDRANHFRRNNDFDKAMGIYEQILNEDNTDAEAYWSLVLCQYGIEYVEDPASHKRIPTVNRAQYTSIFDDDNYKSALANADTLQKTVYEEEARTINEIQKGILEISQKEEPFDVFICYKETDNNGRRTQDSVLANDLYHQLTQEGLKVFFARITLEDKLGSAYEPYIFAALNSAKVMVVLGTKPEFFNAVWVKNEWSRYLALVKQSAGKKMLIPAYRDMDPYDLPEEFSHLQAQDMSKLGFMQDLIRGIKKILQVDVTQTVTETVRETVVMQGTGNANIEPLLKRVFMFLEDRNWDSANEYCEKILDMDPENGEAYLGKLMANLHVSRKENLKNEDKTFDDANNYQKAYRFGDDSIKELLDDATKIISYNEAVNRMESADTEEAFKKAANVFERVLGFLDAEVRAKECYEKAEEARKDAILNQGLEYQKQDTVDLHEKAIQTFTKVPDWKNAQELIQHSKQRIVQIKDSILHRGINLMKENNTEYLEKAIFEFQKIPGWSNADSLILEAKSRIVEIKAAEKRASEELARKQAQEKERAAKKRKRTIAIVSIVLVMIAVAIVILVKVIVPTQQSHKILEIVKQSDIGDTLKFGDYEWQILAKEENRMLIITKSPVCNEPYNREETSVTWEDCTLRKWLNNEFYNEFSDAEKQLIAITHLENKDNAEYGIPGGNATDDKIFLLSIDEVNTYFANDQERAVGCWWWLRSPGEYAATAKLVYSGGAVDGLARLVDYDEVGVRPAMWLNLEP